MSWKKERDSLIAQTMAFVQSVTGRKDVTGAASAGFETAANPAELLAPPALEGWAAPKPIAPIEPVKAAEPPASAPRPVVTSEVANEIRARVAGFRAHQERFTREREEYFSQTLARLKAQISEMPPPTRPDK